jgi:hypothetical protein
MSKDRLDHHHEKGQKDAVEGKYDPPHERIEDVIGNIVAGESDADRADRDAYEAGRDNAEGQ